MCSSVPVVAGVKVQPEVKAVTASCVCWHVLSFSSSTVGGALGTHSTTAHVHTHTCECAHACRPAAPAVKAAVRSHPFSLLSLTAPSRPLKLLQCADDLSHRETQTGGYTWSYRSVIRKWVFPPLSPHAAGKLPSDSNQKWIRQARVPAHAGRGKRRRSSFVCPDSTDLFSFCQYQYGSFTGDYEASKA